MKELAEQELKILESQHPTRFQQLKLELKAFIQLLDDDEEEQSFKRKQQQRFHLSILTEESSSREHEREERKSKRGGGRRRRRREEEEEEEGISDAIQKAEACLRKINTLKSLFGSSNG